jgi:hypothetical protein
MAESTDAAGWSLQWFMELRRRTRIAQDGHWFVLLVFGAVVLGAMPFYVQTAPTEFTPGCHGSGGVIGCVSGGIPPLGGGLNPVFSQFGLSRWATAYWAIAIVAGFGATVLYYRHRARVVGVQGRIWPAVVVGLGLLALVLVVYGGHTVPDFATGDLWVRGLGALLIIAVGLAVLAMIERSLSFGLYVVGFCGLALLSCLYDDVNVLARIGLGGLFGLSAVELPNLLIPGLYLLLGGAAFWLRGHRVTQAVTSPT